MLAELHLANVHIFRKLLIPFLTAIPVASAQEHEPLDEIVVSATRMESALADVGRSISVVSKDRIQNATQLIGLDEVLNGEEKIGCTLHTIVDGPIDTGPIIGQTKMHIRKDWSYLANVLELYLGGCRMMVDAIRKISAGESLETSRQTADGHY